MARGNKNIARNLEVGQILTDMITEILNKHIDKMTAYETTTHRLANGQWLNVADHIVSYDEQIFVIEEKNWPSGYPLDAKNFESKLLSRFTRFEDEFGYKPHEYTRISVLAGINNTATLALLLKIARIHGIFIVSCDEDGAFDEDTKAFVEDALMSILNGSVWSIRQKGDIIK